MAVCGVNLDINHSLAMEHGKQHSRSLEPMLVRYCLLVILSDSPRQVSLSLREQNRVHAGNCQAFVKLTLVILISSQEIPERLIEFIRQFHLRPMAASIENLNCRTTYELSSLDPMLVWYQAVILAPDDHCGLCNLIQMVSLKDVSLLAAKRCAVP